MFKNLFILFSVIGLAACAGTKGNVTSYEKVGEIAGTGGLDIAAKRCAQYEGTQEWQTCVAHHDGLYTKSGGVIKRSYGLSEDAPKPTGKVEKCNMAATWDSVAEVMTYSSCERPTRFR